MQPSSQYEKARGKLVCGRTHYTAWGTVVELRPVLPEGLLEGGRLYIPGHYDADELSQVVVVREECV